MFEKSKSYLGREATETSLDGYVSDNGHRNIAMHIHGATLGSRLNESP